MSKLKYYYKIVEVKKIKIKKRYTILKSEKECNIYFDLLFQNINKTKKNNDNLDNKNQLFSTVKKQNSYYNPSYN